MGTSSAKTIRASGRTSLHNRPDIRLQPCLLKRHTHEFLQSGRRPYKNFPWFGSHDYWHGQVALLREQLQALQEEPLVV